jgi:predicted amidohydrolase YtcJ
MPNPDIILHNGHIFPRADTHRSVQALSIWNGTVTTIGSDQELLRLEARSVETVDLKGKVVIPGLSDSHIHLLGYGILLQNMDLRNTRSLSEIQKAVQHASNRKRSGSWVVGRGWDHEKLLEGRYPTKHDLSHVHQPVFLKRVCGHIAVANESALAAAGIDRTTLDPLGGFIERDPTSGEPTGVLREEAVGLVQRVIPLDEDEVMRALELAAKELLRVGLTSLHCIVENATELKALRRLAEAGEIRQSIYAIIPTGLVNKSVKARPSTQNGASRFRIGGVKVYLDGSLGGHTAALTEPYSDDPSSGVLTKTRGELAEIAEDAGASGFQLSIHAIGDRAVGEALMMIEKTRTAQNGAELRHRIEHASLTPPKLVQKMRKNRVVASVQPSFIQSDTWAEKRLGPLRCRSLYPFRSFVRYGIPLASGSDCPVEDPNPFQGVKSAVVRPGLLPRERLTVREALASYTTGPAFASFAEQYRGTLELGRAADLVVLDRDPFDCPGDELDRINVLGTMVEGEWAIRPSDISPAR